MSTTTGFKGILAPAGRTDGSAPEAIHRIGGDEIEGFVEGQDRAAMQADGSPAIGVRAPVKHLVVTFALLGPKPRDRDARFFTNQRVAVPVFAHQHAAALLAVERLDSVLNEIEQ